MCNNNNNNNNNNEDTMLQDRDVIRNNGGTRNEIASTVLHDAVRARMSHHRMLTVLRTMRDTSSVLETLKRSIDIAMKDVDEMRSITADMIRAVAAVLDTEFDEIDMRD